MTMTAMANKLFTISPDSFSCRRTPFAPSPSPPHFPTPSYFKKGVWGGRFVLLKVNCESESSKGSTRSVPETEFSSASSLKSLSSSCTVIGEADRGISAYKWCAALGGIGFLGTAYLSYMKIMDSGVFCSGEGDSCTTILNSVPLPLFGMVAFGLVATLGLQLQHSSGRTIVGVEETDGEMIVGESLLYCLASSALSFSLFFITLKNFGLDKIKKMFGSQCIASLVIIAIVASYNVVQPVSSSLAATEMPYVETEITKESSPLALSLAEHLRSVGAKLYGAFWCSHCKDQRQMFGREAAKLLDYVECYPDGLGKGTTMAIACYKLEAFPAWEINGQVFSGKKQFSELAKLSGIKLEDLSDQN